MLIALSCHRSAYAGTDFSVHWWCELGSLPLAGFDTKVSALLKPELIASKTKLTTTLKGFDTDADLLRVCCSETESTPCLLTSYWPWAATSESNRGLQTTLSGGTKGLRTLCEWFEVKLMVKCERSLRRSFHTQQSGGGGNIHFVYITNNQHPLSSA